jgi:uncharacterized membrane protein YdjX (TVP38/TMEM64 family)
MGTAARSAARKTAPARKRTRRTILLRVAGGLVLVGALAFAAMWIPWDGVARTIERMGPWGLAAFVGAYVLAAVLLVPVWILNVIAGVAFGFLRGFGVAVLGANLGAIAAFVVARALGRDRLERHIDSERIEAMDRAIARKGFKVVLLLRLSHMPFNVLNYVLGLTRVTFRDFALATFLGLLPSLATVVYVGTVVGSVTGARGAANEREPVEWALLGVAVVAAAACAVVLTRIARRTMGKHAHGAWT